MKTHHIHRRSGFTLMETVIAIGVLAVLLTAFIGVFGPAAVGIRKALSGQEADRLTNAVIQEMTNLREGQKNTYPSAFDKAFALIQKSNSPETALMVYQYRGSLTSQRTDGSAQPVPTIKGIPGQDYVVQPMMRALNDPNLKDDVAAVEGKIYVVKCTQLTPDLSTGEYKAGKPGVIVNPDTGDTAQSSADYTSAVILFDAEFYSVSSNNVSYLTGPAFQSKFPKFSNPVLARNLSVQR